MITRRVLARAGTLGFLGAIATPNVARAQARIRRHGSAVILEPMADDWSWLDVIVGQLDADFVQAVDEQPEQQKRPALDELFR